MLKIRRAINIFHRKKCFGGYYSSVKLIKLSSIEYFTITYCASFTLLSNSLSSLLALSPCSYSSHPVRLRISGYSIPITCSRNLNHLFLTESTLSFFLIFFKMYSCFIYTFHYMDNIIHIYIYISSNVIFICEKIV